LGGGVGIGGAEDLVGLTDLVGGSGAGGAEDLVGLEQLGGPAAGGLEDLVGSGDQTAPGGVALGGVEDLAVGIPTAVQFAAGGDDVNGSTTASLTGRPTAGNILVLIVASQNAVTVDGTWTLLNSSTVGGIGSVYIWSKISTGSDQTTVYTHTAATQSTWAMGEFTRGGLANTLDQIASDAALSVPCDTGATPITTQATELCIGAIMALPRVVPTIGPTAPWQSPIGWFGFDGFLAGYLITTGTGAQEMQSSWITAAQNWVGIIATIK
jgi:hypothetical protein